MWSKQKECCQVQQRPTSNQARSIIQAKGAKSTSPRSLTMLRACRASVEVKNTGSIKHPPKKREATHTSKSPSARRKRATKFLGQLERGVNIHIPRKVQLNQPSPALDLSKTISHSQRPLDPLLEANLTPLGN